MERKVFRDSVTPLPAQGGLTPNGLLVHAADAKPTDDVMTVLFSLEVPAGVRRDIEQRVAAGEVVPERELQQMYTSDAAARESLIAWLQREGFQVTDVTPDGTGVYATARADQIEKSLAVTMTRVTKDGVTFPAAANAPSLPADVGSGVHAIIGLQPFRQMNKHSRRLPVSAVRRPHAVAAGVGVAVAEAPQEVAAAAVPVPPYTVANILRAYRADGLGVTGNGQTIAILIDTFPNDSDLEAFWTRNNLPVTLSQIEKVNVSGGALPPPEGEETLDAAWSSGIAQGATVRIYATGSLSFVDLDRALDRIIADLPSHPGLRQLSISLGLGELFMGGPLGEVATQHQKFLRLAAAGVNVFVSSGDAGSNPDETGHGSNGPLQAEYESSDSAVVGVGGTSLRFSGGAKLKERAWAGSGGGTSIFFARPSWQNAPGVPPGNERLVPDVSLAADPNTGALLVFQGQEIQIGGTSWSAPMWAGFCALINEARVRAGKAPLGFLNPLIYPLAGSPCFRDIEQGSNGEFTSGPGYDLVTGLGVPVVKELLAKLTN
jgi:kumamolisin